MYGLIAFVIGIALIYEASKLAKGSRPRDIVVLCAISGAVGGFLLWSAVQ